MSVDTVVYTELSSDPVLVGLVGDQIYMGRVPQEIGFPVLWCNRLPGVPINVLTKNNAQVLRNYVMQANVEAATMAEADQIAEAARDVFLRFPLNGALEVEFADPGFDEETTTARLTGRVSIMYDGG